MRPLLRTGSEWERFNLGRPNLILKPETNDTASQCSFAYEPSGFRGIEPAIHPVLRTESGDFYPGAPELSEIRAPSPELI